jgi:hypothetical protein
LGSYGAPGPAHRERGGVRLLGTDGAAENKGGAAVTDYRRKATVGAQTKCMGNVPFIVAYHVEATRTYARREGGR